MLYIRTLLGMDGPGLAYVRRSITKQADRVRSGGAANALHEDPDRQKVRFISHFLFNLRICK
jgi:hypothetical protein